MLRSAVTLGSQDISRSLHVNWRTQKVNDVFKSWIGDSPQIHTRSQCTQRTQIKLWQWESEHWLPWQSREPPTAKQSHKKRHRDWRVKLEKNQNVHGVQPVWLIFVISNMIHLFLSLSFLSFSFTFSPCLVGFLVSQLLHLASRVSMWLSGLFSVVPLCCSLMKANWVKEKENLRTSYGAVPMCFFWFLAAKDASLSVWKCRIVADNLNQKIPSKNKMTI